MINGMLESSRGCLKEEIRMDIISNNLANSTVIGFKKDRISFKELLNQMRSGSAQANRPGDKPDSSLIYIQTDLSQGDLRATGNSLDLALFGNGFFKVNTPEGIRYTRKGNFVLDAQGALITQDGYMVMGKGGPISINGSDISIDGRGVILIDGGEAGQFDVVDFDNYKDLVKEGNGLFRNRLDDPGKAPPSETMIKQGYLELSNVNVAEEMVQMIHSLRAFESYQKSIKILDGMDNRAVNDVGRLR
ncbi:MAG: flagellar basal-body rod protein FlgF [Deltaproteobacteria bacterium]|nr:flagellar basal-body rod protein FlgF [Deltaproteobacteria bacterium]